MKRFKGTKGRWVVKHSESKTAFNIVGTKIGEKYKIARCPYLIIGERENLNFNVREKDQANADAQLIATAPELLEALIKIVEENKNMIGDTPLNNVIRESESIINKTLGHD